MTKERPILFSGAMVRAILDGRKTQTRRIVKPCKDINVGCMLAAHELAGEVNRGDLSNSRYGKPGDRLWVRETWSADFANHYPNDRVWYAADDDRHHDIEVRDGVRGIYSPESGVHVPFRWRPSIHMPRAACRLALEITGVRVERLNDCSEADAVAEGLHILPASGRYVVNPGEQYFGAADHDPRVVYADLWDRINGAGAWEANPWVWVVEFRRIAP